MELHLDTNQYIILDTETTGLDPNDSEITEVAFCKINNGDIIAKYSSVIDIEAPEVPEIITNITGITREFLSEHGRDPREVYEEVYKYIKGEIFVAYNAEFDLRMIDAHFKKYLNISYKPLYIDALEIARDLYKAQIYSCKLERVAHHLGIDKIQDHRALSDVIMTNQVLEIMKSNKPEDFLSRYIRDAKDLL